MVEHGRAILPQHHRRSLASGRLPKRRRSQESDQSAHRRVQQQTQALCLDRQGQRHPPGVLRGEHGKSGSNSVKHFTGGFTVTSQTSFGPHIACKVHSPSRRCLAECDELASTRAAYDSGYPLSDFGRGHPSNQNPASVKPPFSYMAHNLL